MIAFEFFDHTGKKRSASLSRSLSHIHIKEPGTKACPWENPTSDQRRQGKLFDSMLTHELFVNR
jgi:hypothetical protein